MKLMCNNHGCHFPAEFDQTLLPDCNFWGEHGMSNMSKELKKKLWDWAFTLPSDEIFILTGISIAFSFQGVVTESKETFESTIPGWAIMSEVQKQLYEKKYFKWVLNGKQGQKPAPPIVNMPDEKKYN